MSFWVRDDSVPAPAPTDQVREVDGHPAYEARKRVVEFLTQRLTG